MSGRYIGVPSACGYDYVYRGRKGFMCCLILGIIAGSLFLLRKVREWNEGRVGIDTQTMYYH